MSFWYSVFLAILVFVSYLLIVDITSTIWHRNWFEYQKKLIKYKMELEGGINDGKDNICSKGLKKLL